jgi:hypothetical protein
MCIIKTTPMVLSMWHNKMKMDGKNENMSLWLNKMFLAQHFFHKRLNFIKGIVKHNEYDLTSMMNVINKI